MLRARVLPETKELLIPNDPAVMALLGDNVKLDGDHHLSMPHTIETTRLLRNLEYIVPAPIVHHYPWPDNPAPFRTQKITAALLTMNLRAYVLSEMGTGKTRAALYAWDYMYKEGVAKRMLVVAPLSTLSQVWDREIFQYFPEYSVGVVHGTKAKRQKILKEHHQIYVINHDGLGVVMDDLLAMNFDVCIIDEVGAFRNKSTERWKKMSKLIQNIRYAWGMTGSPTPNDPTDAFGLAKLLTPRNAPRYFREFQRKTMTQITTFKWFAKPDANERVFEMLQPAVRYRRDDCVELPETTYKTIDLPPSPQIKKTYKLMIQALRAAFKEGKISAANEGVLFMKLMQVACGYVYTDDRNIVKLDNTNRVLEVEDIIDQSIGKVIVFANFTHAATELHKRLVGKKYDVSLVHGGISKTHRDQIFGGFQNGDSPKVIVAHPKCMSHGLTLTAASTIVWFTPTTSLETYEQANARITRPGQEHKTMIIHLTGTAIESKIYKRLQQKASLQGALLDMFDDN